MQPGGPVRWRAVPHLHYRHKLVQMHTRVKNSLQALAFSAVSAGRSKLLSLKGREQFLQLPMSEAMARQREEWLSLVEELNTTACFIDGANGNHLTR